MAVQFTVKWGKHTSTCHGRHSATGCSKSTTQTTCWEHWRRTCTESSRLTVTPEHLLTYKQKIIQRLLKVTYLLHELLMLHLRPHYRPRLLNRSHNSIKKLIPAAYEAQLELQLLPGRGRNFNYRQPHPCAGLHKKKTANKILHVTGMQIAQYLTSRSSETDMAREAKRLLAGATTHQDNPQPNTQYHSTKPFWWTCVHLPRGLN